MVRFAVSIPAGIGLSNLDARLEYKRRECVALPSKSEEEPVLELVSLAKLVQSGVDQKVVLTYMENSPPKRTPTAEELVFLHELGLSSEVMVALMNAGAKVSLTETQPTVAASSDRIVEPLVSTRRNCANSAGGNAGSGAKCAREWKRGDLVARADGGVHATCAADRGVYTAGTAASDHAARAGGDLCGAAPPCDIRI
jgi:hypothetical protein